MGNNQGRDASSSSGVDEIKIRFADGSVAWFPKGSAFDFVFAPVFLKYIVICVAIYGLLHHREDLATLDAWEQVAIWATVFVTYVLWFLFAIIFLSATLRFFSVLVIYTPFVTLPGVLMAMATTHVVLLQMLPADATVLTFQIDSMIRAIFVMLLFDMLFGSFVAAHHPLLRTEDHVGARPVPRQQTENMAPFGFAGTTGAPGPARPDAAELPEPVDAESTSSSPPPFISVAG